MKVSPKNMKHNDENQKKNNINSNNNGSPDFNLPFDNDNNNNNNNNENNSNNNNNNNNNNNSPATIPNIVDIYNLHKTYLLGIEGVPALRGVNLKIQQGHFVMLLGKSGSGKTSLLNLIGTIDQPTRGDLQVCGINIKNGMSDAIIADLRLQHLGFVFQTFNLINSMTAFENVMLPTLLQNGEESPAARERALSLLRRVGMGDRLGHYPSQLSGGEQQRVTIARALVNSPSILLLDEPTGDLDTKNTENVMRLLLGLNLEGVTMIMVTHDPNLKSYAHRCVHMMDGRIYNDETIDPSVRERKIKELVGVNDTDGIPTSVIVEQQQEERTQNSNQPIVMKKTELRQPKDFYSVLT